MFRLLAWALCNINATSGDDPLQAAAIRTAGSEHIFVIKGRPLPGDEIM
jgi:hypothetical protein